MARAPRAYEGPRSRLEALIEASLALNEAPDLESLLRRILDLATASVDAERGALFRVEPGTGALEADIFHGDELARIRVARGRGLAGEVASSGRPVRIADAYADPRFDPSVDAATGYRTRSLLVVPLRHRSGEVVGVLEVLNKRAGAFDEDDEAFLEAFGAHAAVALENARLADERVRAERLAAVGTAVARLVHDLKSPLGGLQGYADLLAQDPPEELRARCLDGLRRQGQRMRHMLQSILAFVRGEEAWLFARTDLDALLDEAVADLGAALSEARVEVSRAPGRAGQARVDAMAVRRLLDNLARNGAEAMPGGGRLLVGASAREGEVVLEVSDTGVGMTEVQRRRLFEPFATTGKAEGTGLGMGIVLRIVEAHGGRIEVTSEPGRGTCVRVRLPAAGPSAAGQAPAR
jgi:signal transduction histidine kinase